MESLPGLKEKVAIVTGHKSGIGAAIYSRFREQGALVYGMDLPEVDLTHPEDIASAVQSVFKERGRVDVLVNNAGVTSLGNLVETSVEELDSIFDINFRAPFLLMKEVIPLMQKNHKGAIVNICSDQAFIGKKNSAAYGSSKGALAQLTRSAALDWAPHGIRVNAIAPGSTDTPMLRRVTEELKKRYPNTSSDADRAYQSAIPQARFAHPDEIAWAVAFLASDAASFITGIILPVDGGFTAQ